MTSKGLTGRNSSRFGTYVEMALTKWYTEQLGSIHYPPTTIHCLSKTAPSPRGIETLHPQPPAYGFGPPLSVNSVTGAGDVCLMPQIRVLFLDRGRGRFVPANREQVVN